MKACHTLVCFIILTAQQDGLVNAETPRHRKMEGEDVTLECTFLISGSRRLFSVKISTPGSTPKAFSSSTFLLSTSTTATTAATTTQSFNFSLESATSTSSSTEILNPSETPAGPDKPLYVILILVIMITLLSAALLIFYKKMKAIKPKGPPVETEYANITQNNRLCEEIRDGGSPPAEVSSADAFPKTCQRAGVENLELYSLITYSQSKAENDTDEVDYTEVDFSHISVTNSTLCGKSGDVVYSTPQIHASPRNHVKDASPPLYSIKPKLK
ncbi:uncharacterized protein LOC113013548 isoform X4 [Astatotilapia calliptera]|uniref:uncharacterized protein LOC113013548 isoform X4 n=1 Tax=Astatotilapia calliptera TaxID=8154 RepID=UPI000E41AB84|nr:uncharacterized protein LOC113013548 isoform X4 [Astatotilapia calliptera]